MTEEVTKYKFWRVEIDDRHKMPRIFLNQNQQFFPYGDRNDYCDYLVQLYNRSSVHSTIVKHKVKFVSGKGFAVNQSKNTAQLAEIEAFLRSPNRTGQYANDILERIALDLELFNGFALEVIWNPLTKKPIAIYHKDWTSLRIDRNQNGVWHSQYWTQQQSIRRYVVNSIYNLPMDATFIPFFNADTVGMKECKQIYYFTAYTAQMKPYPMPEYISCNTAIETDIEIDNFDLNNVKTGFAAGGMWTFFNGEPSDEEMKVLDKQIKGKMAGTDNGGNILLSFQKEGSTPPQWTSFRPNELADQYEQLKNRTRDAIFVGHQVNNPMLFGIKTEGQLGGRTEVVEAYEQFQNVYVNSRQQVIERCFNEILSYKFDTESDTIKIVPTEPIGMAFTEDTMVAVLPKAAIADMIANKLGIDLTKYAPETAAVQNVNLRFADEKKKENEGDDELLSLFAGIGTPDTGEGDIFEFDISCDDDADRFEGRFKFASVPILSIDDPLRPIYDIIRAEGEITLAKISEKLKVPEADVIRMLNQLQRLNIIDYKTEEHSGKITIDRIGEAATRPTPEEGYRVTVKYKYHGPQDSKNRPFCKGMLSMNRLYTRAEINQLSEKTGRNIWLTRGGWYHDPNTGVNRPSCRHNWKQVVIKERING